MRRGEVRRVRMRRSEVRSVMSQSWRVPSSLAVRARFPSALHATAGTAFGDLGGGGRIAAADGLPQVSRLLAHVSGTIQFFSSQSCLSVRLPP
ncbi:hypothetical protein GCM10020000_82060 [Streptomyces olivoverticillatus]